MNKPREESKYDRIMAEESETMPTGKKIEKWEKEFDDEFKGENEFKNGDYIVEDQAIYIKNFISDLLSSQLKEVLKIIESKRKPDDVCKCFTLEDGGCGCQQDDYNQALGDIIDLLSSV